jgi:hypothetical protein
MYQVIDARSGKKVNVGQRVDYPPFMGKSDFIKLEAIGTGIFSATITVTTPAGTYTTRRPIRYMHPAFFLQPTIFLAT